MIKTSNSEQPGTKKTRRPPPPLIPPNPRLPKTGRDQEAAPPRLVIISEPQPPRDRRQRPKELVGFGELPLRLQPGAH